MSRRDEHDIQCECVRWYRANYPSGVIFAVPNQGRRTAAQMQYFINEGFTVGAPDLVVVLPNATTVFIEMKTATGKQSKHQVELQEKLDKLDEHLYYVCRSLEDFVTVIEYLVEDN